MEPQSNTAPGVLRWNIPNEHFVCAAGQIHVGIILFSCWLNNKLATNPTGSSLILVTGHFPGQMAPLTHCLQAEVAANISL